MANVMTFTVLGANKYNIDGNTFCSLFVIESDLDDKTLKGFRPAKMKCEPVVFEQLTEGESAYPLKEDFLVQQRVKSGSLDIVVKAIAPKTAKKSA
jgi:hypothetical protein